MFHEHQNEYDGPAARRELMLRQLREMVGGTELLELEQAMEAFVRAAPAFDTEVVLARDLGAKMGAMEAVLIEMGIRKSR